MDSGAGRTLGQGDPELHRNGHDRVQAVELPLTSLADDAGRTRKMIRQIDGPVLLVGHSYGGAVISQAGNEANVKGLVYIAAFAPDAGESPGGITQQHLPEAAPNPHRTAMATCGCVRTSSMRASAGI